MKFTETKLKGAFVVELTKLTDERGFFARSWCKQEMEAHGLKTNIVQINTSLSLKKGTLRGMHYQKHPYEETKLVRCTRGAIFDVIVDLRKDSPTFKQWFGIELNENNHTMLYIPEKFAHGFITLTDNCEITYLNTQFYHREVSMELRYNEPEFNIIWPLPVSLISEKDKNAPDFNIELLP